MPEAILEVSDNMQIFQLELAQPQTGVFVVSDGIAIAHRGVAVAVRQLDSKAMRTLGKQLVKAADDLSKVENEAGDAALSRFNEIAGNA